MRKEIFTTNSFMKAHGWTFILVCALFVGCDTFLETEQPIGQIEKALVFENEALATASVTSLYSQLRDDVLVSGGYTGMGYLMGLYADELDYYSLPGLANENFYLHQVTPSNTIVKNVWNASYNLVYMTNSILEGLESSQSLPEPTKRQLTGETLFVRALTHFYLVNLFGDIPYVRTTDPVENQNVGRMDVNVVYDSILNDLEAASDLLTEDYPSYERIRANKYVVSALKARVYLYTQQWELAAVASHFLITNPGMFSMEENISEEFLKGSSSAILQLKPAVDGRNTTEGQLLNFSFGPPFNVALTPDLIASMSPQDLRRQLWVKEVSNGSQTWYAATKYKQNQPTGVSKEYAIVFRLAEQYLIRAEARLHLGDLEGAKADINMVRQRAALPPTSALTYDEIMEALIKERRIELFTEHGHRWFDLKRCHLANTYLSPIKQGWRPTDILLPLPERELSSNSKLKPQNPGY